MRAVSGTDCFNSTEQKLQESDLFHRPVQQQRTEVTGQRFDPQTCPRAENRSNRTVVLSTDLLNNREQK